MELKKLIIQNYKSIEFLEFEITKIKNSYTYSLLGVNESGKSSLLKAISLIDNEDLIYPTDYFNDSLPVCIKLYYVPDEDELKELKKKLIIESKFNKDLADKIRIEQVEIIIQYDPNPTPSKKHSEAILFENFLFSEYTLKETYPQKKTKEDFELEGFSLSDFFEKNFKDYFWKISHHIIFWKSSPEYLLLDELDLLKFSKSPKSVSIPLLNCFILCGIDEDKIEKEINKLNSPVSINSLQSKLGELTTKHINSVWPEHPISITFQINNNKISLLIEDNGVKYQPRTTGQRSDGFKQFISFLLTVSVENYNDELSNTILLIDEPETHLHPPAQINLLKELIKITGNDNNNILFFATHSNYLIDKDNLDRNFKVFKKDNLRTNIKKIEKKSSTYSEVNYEVFGIQTSDYHNELYGYIEFENKNLLINLPKTKKWIDSRNNKEKDVSVSEYIRHSIHHPENILNKKYTDKELGESIKKLIELKHKK